MDKTLSYTPSAPKLKPDYFHDAIDKIQVRTDQRPAGTWDYCAREPKFGMPPWRVQTTMPAAEQIQVLEGGMVNYVEIARDYVLLDLDSQETFKDLLDKHSWRPYERAGTQTFRISTTTYSRRKRSCGARLVRYTPRFSKITGEVHVVRIEWQAAGVRACRAIGIHSPTDLLKFDFDAFWHRKLRLYEFDSGKLGQVLSGRDCRRRPTQRDRRVGTLACRAVEPIGTVQDVIARFGKRAKKALRPHSLQDLIYNNAVKLPVYPLSLCNNYPFPKSQQLNISIPPTPDPYGQKRGIPGF